MGNQTNLDGQPDQPVPVGGWEGQFQWGEVCEGQTTLMAGWET